MTSHLQEGLQVCVQREIDQYEIMFGGQKFLLKCVLQLGRPRQVLLPLIKTSYTDILVLLIVAGCAAGRGKVLTMP